MCNGQLKGRDGLATDSGDVPASDLRPHTDTLFYARPRSSLWKSSCEGRCQP